MLQLPSVTHLPQSRPCLLMSGYRMLRSRTIPWNLTWLRLQKLPRLLPRMLQRTPQQRRQLQRHLCPKQQGLQQRQLQPPMSSRLVKTSWQKQ